MFLELCMQPRVKPLPTLGVGKDITPILHMRIAYGEVKACSVTAIGPKLSELPKALLPCALGPSFPLGSSLQVAEWK